MEARWGAFDANGAQLSHLDDSPLSQTSNLSRSPAHLSGAATPNKDNSRAVGSIGPPNLTKSPQGPGSGSSIQSIFKPLGVPISDGLSLSPQQRSRNAFLKQQQQQQQQQSNKMFSGAHNMRTSVVLEPGGGLTNPGPGPFGRGPSPFEANLGRGPSPPNGLPREQMTPPPLMDDMIDRLSQLSMSPSQHEAQQLSNTSLPANMSAMMAAQLVQQGNLPQQMLQQLPPSMMTNQQLMMQAQQQLQMQQQLQQKKMNSGGANWMQADMPPKGYKTVICKFWENNMCAKGSTCTFAHGADELQRFSSSGVTAGLTPPSPLKLDRYKTKLCLFHMQSRCSKGSHCPYAHGMQELRAGPPGLSGPLSGPDITPAFFQQQQQQQGVQNMGMSGMMGNSMPMGNMLNMGKNEERQQNMFGQSMMGNSGMFRDMQTSANMLNMGNPKEDEEPLLFTSVDQDAGTPQERVTALDGLRGVGDDLRENDGDLDAAQQMAAMRYFAQQKQQQQHQLFQQQQRMQQHRMGGKMNNMGGMHMGMGMGMGMPNVPDKMNSVAGSYGFRG